MKVEYLVANVVPGLVGVTTQVEGQDTRAMIEGVQVELVPAQSRNGSVNLSFFGKDLEEAKSVFKKDGKVSFTIEAVQ